MLYGIHEFNRKLIVLKELKWDKMIYTGITKDLHNARIFEILKIEFLATVLQNRFFCVYIPNIQCEIELMK